MPQCPHSQDSLVFLFWICFDPQKSWTTEEESRVGGGSAGSRREACGENCDGQGSLSSPAEAVHWLSGLWMWNCLQASVSSSVYIAETRAGLWG